MWTKYLLLKRKYILFIKFIFYYTLHSYNYVPEIVWNVLWLLTGLILSNDSFNQ